MAFGRPELVLVAQALQRRTSDDADRRCVFLPSSGYCYFYLDEEADWVDDGDLINYWSSTRYEKYRKNQAYCLQFVIGDFIDIVSDDGSNIYNPVRLVK